MSLLSKLADRLILCPSTDPIDSQENRREVVHRADGVEVEAYVSCLGDFDNCSPNERLIVLKFPGTGGRAERATVHPCELMINCHTESPFQAAEVWTLNHRGYGNSTGPASMQNFVTSLESFWEFIHDRFPAETKLATGNSLGCISALYMSRWKSIDAILIRNPPPLARLISSRPRYNAWNFGMGKHIADEVPRELDSLANGSLTRCPALMVSSEKDRVVPFKYQLEIMDVYLGAVRQFVIEAADHHHRIPEHQESEYLAAVEWLHDKLTDRAAKTH